MSGRSLLLLVLATVSAASGWWLGWPELTACGAGLGMVLVVARAAVLHHEPVRITLSHAPTAERGTPVRAEVRLESQRRRRVALVDANGRTLQRAPDVQDEAWQLPVDTTHCGVRPVGPVQAVIADLWGLESRSLGESAGQLLVLPRVHPVRRDWFRALGEDQQMAPDRRGDEHFFSLRDYVIGDEPREVHWRSSARAGRLLVKQRVGASQGAILLLLDTDATAWLTSGLDETSAEDRFDLGKDVAASLLAHWAARDCVTLAVAGTPVRTHTIVSGSIDRGLAVLAQADVGTAATDAQHLSTALRVSGHSAVVVSGSPGPALVAWVRSLRGGTAAVVRVGSRVEAAPPGIRCLDVRGAEDLG